MTVLLRGLLLIGLLYMGLASAWAAETLSGEALYYVCSVCHGVKGEGMVARRAPKIAGLEAWYLNRQLNNYKAGIRGDNPEDLYGRQMILFARTLQLKGDIEKLSTYIASFPDTLALQTITGDRIKGGENYEVCADCHGQRAEGNSDFGAPRLAGMDDWYLTTRLRNFRSGALDHYAKDESGKQKTTVSASLLTNDASIMDVVAYINYLGTNDSTKKRGPSAK